MLRAWRVLALVACVGSIWPAKLWGSDDLKLGAGAAKVDITPAAELLPFRQENADDSANAREPGFVGVHDRLWARAIVVQNGSSSAAIVALDLERVPNAEEMVRRISTASGIAAERIVVSATHTHSDPTMTVPEGGGTSAKWKTYCDVVVNGAVKAVQGAKENLQPARIGYGTGSVDINRNNGEEPGAEPVSDKTVAVMKIETLAGEPIALLFNYAMHSGAAFHTMTRKDGWEISGDIVGMAAAIIENRYKDKAVALFTMAAAGDQAPQYTGHIMTPGTKEWNDLGAETWPILHVEANSLATEVVRVADVIDAATTEGRIWGAQTSVTCPGQKSSGSVGSTNYTTESRGPVGLRLALLAIGDVAIAAIGGEIPTKIGWEIRSGSSLGKIFVVTQAGGAAGYILQDSSYQRLTHAVMSSPFKPGCIEPAILWTLRTMEQDYVAGR